MAILCNMDLFDYSKIRKLGCVYFKLYLLIPENKMIEMYMPMFVTSLLNFIPGIKCPWE